jgi:hypothetical protein
MPQPQLRKFSGIGNVTRDLWTSSQELRPLDQRGDQKMESKDTRIR